MGSGYRVFTAGEVLTASNVQDYLMDQSVMSFADSTARATSIGTANFEEGMLSYLQDTNQLEVYNGTSWASIAPTTTQGLTLINTTSFSGVSSVSVNDVFSATYNTYKIVVATDSALAAARFTMRLRVGGVDNSSANYDWAGAEYASLTGAIAYTNSSGQTSATIGITGTQSSVTEIIIHNPFTANNPAIFANSASADGASGGRSLSWSAGARLTVTTSYTGFTILGATFTGGKVSTYGVNQ
jgi:hypothetical protein